MDDRLISADNGGSLRIWNAAYTTAWRMLITAGPTFEPIDAVRGITNLSSGKMGYAVAQAALEAGAPGGGFTLATGDGVLKDTEFARIRRLVELARAAEAHVAVLEPGAHGKIVLVP